ANTASIPNLDWNGGSSGPPATGTTWNTTGTNTNWFNHGTTTPQVAYNDPDTVNFTQAGVSTGSAVTVASGGVNPGSVNITNTSSKYTFSGGSIGGTGAVTMDGAGGSAEFTASNGYSGGTI